MTQLLTRKEAADYCGVRDALLKNAVQEGTGPAFFRPTPRTRLFRTEDLDAWVASWTRVEPRVAVR